MIPRDLYEARCLEAQPSSFVSCSGSRKHRLFSGRYDNAGRLQLNDCGEEDIQVKINSFRSATDLHYMISRLKLGDPSVMASGALSYADFTEMPRSHAECINLVDRSEKAFMTLPLDVRGQFDNDFYKWFSTIGTSEWLEKMSSVQPAQSNAAPSAPIAPSEAVPSVEAAQK